MTETGHGAVAEDFIAMMGETGGFDVMLCLKLIDRSKELPTAATSDQLFTDVLGEMVQKHWDALQSYRHRGRKAPRMIGREIPAIVEALKPLCVRAFPMLNIMLSTDRDYLFLSREYIRSSGRFYYEEAPSVTFTRYLNDMARHRGNGSEVYAREVSRISEVHALNRVANIMPPQFHHGWSGMLQPGQSVEAKKLAEVQHWRDQTGIHTKADLIAEAGLA